MQFESDYHLDTCAECGIQFAMPQAYVKKLRETHKAFYCPNGHTLWYAAKTKAEELEEQLKLERDRKNYFYRKAERILEEKKHVENQRNGYKGMLARVKKEQETKTNV